MFIQYRLDYHSFEHAPFWTCAFLNMLYTPCAAFDSKQFSNRWLSRLWPHLIRRHASSSMILAAAQCRPTVATDETKNQLNLNVKIAQIKMFCYHLEIYATALMQWCTKIFGQGPLIDFLNRPCDNSAYICPKNTFRTFITTILIAVEWPHCALI